MERGNVARLQHAVFVEQSIGDGVVLLAVVLGDKTLDEFGNFLLSFETDDFGVILEAEHSFELREVIESVEVGDSQRAVFGQQKHLLHLLLILMKMCEVNFDFQLLLHNFQEKFHHTLNILFPQLFRHLIEFVYADAEEGFVPAGIHLAVEEGELLAGLLDLIIELLDAFALHREDHKGVEKLADVGLRFHGEAGVLVVDHDALELLVELHLHLEHLLDALHPLRQRGLEQPEDALHFSQFQTPVVDGDHCDVEPHHFLHLLAYLEVLQGGGVEHDPQIAPEVLEPGDDGEAGELLPEEGGAAYHGDDGGVLGVEDGEAVLEFHEFVAADGVEGGVLGHEDAQVVAVAVQLVVVLDLDALQILVEGLHEDLPAVRVPSQLHDLVLRVALRPLQQVPVGPLPLLLLRVLLHLVAHLQLPLALELHQLVLLLEPRLHQELPQLRLLQQPQEHPALPLALHRVLHLQVLPHRLVHPLIIIAKQRQLKPHCLRGGQGWQWGG